MGFEFSAGKWQRLRSLTDEQGRFKMLAIDQRGSLERALSRAGGGNREITTEDMARAKEAITKILAPYSTAVLTDPLVGYPYTIQRLPPRVGLLLAHEESGYQPASAGSKERLTELIEGWTAEKAQRAGADAVKLLVYYRPDMSSEMRKHQQDLVRRVGEECLEADMPFLLELVGYALKEPGENTPEYALKKPEIVIKSAEEFSRQEYHVDILKLEFPSELKWTREFAGGAFDGKAQEAVYDLKSVRERCRELNEASGTPWVILSAGVDIEEFLTQVSLATEAGASGFLCGRAIWKDAAPLYPNMEQMEGWLCDYGVYNFLRANASAHRAMPWFRHRRFGGGEGLGLAQKGERWHREYAKAR
ncbi:MAG: DUF2090 domain-containing protein [SAR202 cluster bacterium]|nr:DUF2090 domain-containing protein [SAR202 cluster bacterium]